MPPVEDVVVAVVKEDEQQSDQAEGAWYVYIVNLKDTPLRNLLVTSTGYGELDGAPRKTSTLRHFFDELDAGDFAKVEPIMDFTFGLSNEYWISFQMNDVMYDKRYIFLPESIQEKNCSVVPILNKRGVMIR